MAEVVEALNSVIELEFRPNMISTAEAELHAWFHSLTLSI